MSHSSFIHGKKTRLFLEQKNKSISTKILKIALKQIQVFSITAPGIYLVQSVLFLLVKDSLPARPDRSG